MFSSHFLRIAALSGLVAAASSVTPAMAASPKISADTLAALQTIKRDAGNIASGKVHGKAQLDAPAHEIAVAWAKATNELNSDGNVRVETTVTNKSIAQFEQSYASDAKARAAAKDLAADVDDLLSATKS